MKRFLLPAILTVLVAAPVSAQTEEQAVIDVIRQVFDGMREQDSAKIRSLMHESTRMGRAPYGNSMNPYNPGSPDGWLNFVGTPNANNMWNETVWDVQVHVLGTLATAWVPYAFFMGPEGRTFRHCGVNSMQFVKVDGDWKLVQLVDVEAPEAECGIPQSMRETGRPFVMD